MIEVVYKKKKVSTKPHYLLVYNYMIGDANGDTTEKVKLSVDNPYIEKFVKLLNSLKPTKETWGLILDFSSIERIYKEGQINKKDYNFLLRIMFKRKECESNISDEDNYANEFFKGVRSETPYTFLVFKGCDLFYIDENGSQFNTIFK